jgi:hypothetical protein
MSAIELKSVPSTEVETVELFAIDGVSYYIPKKPRVNIALRYLKMAREQGPDAASAYLLEALVGEEAYEALMNFDDLDSETLGAIAEAAQKYTLGGLEAPKGK